MRPHLLKICVGAPTLITIMSFARVSARVLTKLTIISASNNEDVSKLCRDEETNS